MEKETKIVLAVKGESALYLYQSYDKTEFVVAYTNGPVKIGDYVESWSCGNYFWTLEDAVDYFKTRKY